MRKYFMNWLETHRYQTVLRMYRVDIFLKICKMCRKS